VIRGASAALSLFAISCSLQSSAVAPSNATGSDAGTTDASVPISDGSGDSTAMSVVTLDGASVDATAVDASGDAAGSDADAAVADTSVAEDTAVPLDTAMPPPSCDSLFSGFVPGYVPCDDRPDACEFYTYTDGGPSCRELCDMAGLTCVTSWSEGSTECERSSDYGCDHRHTDGICICAR
jgi:hypothetical protein